MSVERDTIAAVATPAGAGGIGVVRVSGPLAPDIGRSIFGRTLEPRHAHYGPFLGAGGDELDRGIALLFRAPHSFTGEEVLELQGHGGMVVLDRILRRTLELGARPARPGEFCERAFLNDKIDLAQAEAIADLIASSSEEAARSAVRSLQGVFSRRIDDLVAALTRLRTYVEAALDFPEEEIDFLADERVAAELNAARDEVNAILAEARQGVILRDGATVVIAGRPNAGKSTLLNALAGRDRAIVTEVPGTTRDVLREELTVEGVPLRLVDTAGLRPSGDAIEQEGVRRAWREIESADLVLLVVDAADEREDSADLEPELEARLPDAVPVTVVRNKQDQLSPERRHVGVLPASTMTSQAIGISAREGLGLDDLRRHLLERLGFRAGSEGNFSARRRHLAALELASTHLERGREELTESGAGELLAENLRSAQHALSEITGAFTTDDLLGRIFSEFCIGK